MIRTRFLIIFFCPSPYLYTPVSAPHHKQTPPIALRVPGAHGRPSFLRTSVTHNATMGPSARAFQTASSIFSHQTGESSIRLSTSLPASLHSKPSSSGTSMLPLTPMNYRASKDTRHIVAPLQLPSCVVRLPDRPKKQLRQPGDSALTTRPRRTASLPLNSSVRH